MARRPILSCGVCALAALNLCTWTAPSNFFASTAGAPRAAEMDTSTTRASGAAEMDTSTKSAPRAEEMDTSTEMAPRAEGTSAAGSAIPKASLKMLLSATNLFVVVKMLPLDETGAKVYTIDETGATVYTSQRGDWYPFFVNRYPQKVILLTGQTDEVYGAYQKLSEAIEETRDGTVRQYFLVPVMATGALIGSGGEIIKHAQNETGADIRVIRAPSNEGLVSISGAPQSVSAAVKWLLDTIDANDLGHYAKFNTAYHAPGSCNQQTELDLHIPQEKFGLLIGTGGKALARYSRDSLCKLDLDKEKGTLKIAGHLGDVQMAVQYITQGLSVKPSSEVKAKAGVALGL